MITLIEYRKHPLAYWMGKRVRLLDDMESGEKTYPAGMIMEIYGKYGGFNLRSVDVCPHCGVGIKHYLSGVKPENLELADPNPKRLGFFTEETIKGPRGEGG